MFSMMYGTLMAKQPIILEGILVSVILELTLFKLLWTVKISNTNTFTNIYHLDANILWGRPYFDRKNIVLHRRVGLHYPFSYRSLQSLWNMLLMFITTAQLSQTWQPFIPLFWGRSTKCSSEHVICVQTSYLIIYKYNSS